jgi:hypothetical protein
MSRFSAREILLVLALAAVSINWAWDHWTQVQLQEEWLSSVAREQSHDLKLQSPGVGVEQHHGNSPTH